MGTKWASAFGELLRRYRTAAALSQEELAARAGLSLRGVSDLERGARRAPRLETVRLLADALGLAQPERAALLAARGAAPTAPGQAPPSVAAERPSLPTPPAPPALEGSLVGRAAEFTTLVARYHAAGRGRPQAVVLQGEAGIGKTRLASEFLGWAAAQGADVLHGRAFEAGARLPYQPLVDAVRPRLEREDAPEALLSDTWLGELSRLLPELRDRRPDLPVPVGDEAAARTRLFEALARLGRALAARAPLVLFVDDVQWTDVTSLDVLRYAGRRWTQEHAPVMLLVCLRSEALTTTPALAEWLLGLHRDLDVAQLDLGPLTFEDTVQLLYGLGSETSPAPAIEEFARWIFSETSGQPFFVIETLRALLERGALAPRRREDGAWAIDVVRTPEPGARRGFLPPNVRRIIQARLAPLTPTARDLLSAAAVLGQGFAFELLCRVGRLTDDDALPALDTVLQGHLLREPGDGEGRVGAGHYVFAHDKIREVVYAEAGEARRCVFHRRALDALEAATAPAAELARHALAAGLDEPALRFSVAAGDEAMRLLAPRDAADHYQRTISLAERLERGDLLADLHARRGHAFVSAAMWPDAKRELEAALAGLGAGERERPAEILVDLAETNWWLLDVPAVHGHATAALALANQLGRGDLETKAIAWQAAAEGSAGNLPAIVEQTRRAIDRARALGIAPPAIAGHFESLTLYWLGRLGEAVESGREAVTTAREANDIPWTILSLPHLGLALAGSGRYAEAMRAFEEARRLGREYGLENFLARSIAMSAGFHLDVFDFAGAETIAQEARDLACSLNFPPPAVSAGIDLLLNYARRHEVSRAEQLVDEVAAVAEQAAGFHGWLWRLRLVEARTEIALARGDWPEALRWADAAIEQSRARGRVKYQVLGLTTRAQALIALARTPEAIADLETAVALARPVGDPALLLRAIAGLLAVAGNDALAAEGGAAIARIAGALPDAELRRRFETAELVRVLSKQTLREMGSPAPR